MKIAFAALLGAMLFFLNACGGNDPLLIYCKGKVTLSGMGQAGIVAGLGSNAFSISGDCGEGAYIYRAPPPGNFEPKALAPPPLE